MKKMTMLTGILSLAVGAMVTFGTVLPAYASLGTPQNLDIVGGKYTNDTTPTFTWNKTAGATWYEMILDDGDWKGIGNVDRYTTSTLPDGWHTFFLRARDNNGQVSVSASLTIEIDTKGPSISSVTPTTAKTGIQTSFSVMTSGEAAVTGCWLYVDAVKQGQMFPASNGDAHVYTGSVTFTTTGSHTVYARCVDGDKNYSSGPTTTISVSRGSVIDPGIILTAGTLVKPKCESYEPKVGTCHSVYYYGKDGMVHAFPLESIYRSWYGSSFSNVKEIETWQFNRLAIGENVTMRPGTSLVKFMGSSAVYAVEQGGVLRPIVNEAVAKAIYGSSWDKVIVELPGSVKYDYTFGAKIDDSSDYSKVKAYYSVKTVEDNF